MVKSNNDKKNQLNGMANEVLDFLSKQKQEKLVRCQCGEPRQKVGFFCLSCGEVVQDE